LLTISVSTEASKKIEGVTGVNIRGFTLIELLLVIGIIATLAVVTFVALDPAKRFQDVRFHLLVN